MVRFCGYDNECSGFCKRREIIDQLRQYNISVAFITLPKLNIFNLGKVMNAIHIYLRL
jgi:hypothetical protein